MPHFIKKPVMIEAIKFRNDESSYKLLHWINEGQNKNKKELASWVNGRLIIPTLEGNHFADEGDWIVCGIAGEFYPCKPDIFEKTYVPA